MKITLRHRIPLLAALLLVNAISTGTAAPNKNASSPLGQREEKVHHGGDFFLPLYGSNEAADYAATKETFRQWIAAAKLTPCGLPSRPPADPFPMQGMEQQWYARAGSPQPFFRVIFDKAHHQISATTNFEGDLTGSEWSAERARQQDFWLSVLAWFQDHAKGNVIWGDKDPAAFFTNMRNTIAEQYKQ